MIQNKIAESGIITLDLEKLIPSDDEIMIFDLAPFLFKGLILREKDFREDMKNYDFLKFKDHYVGVICSADALIPMWAYMLVMTYLQGISKKVFYGDSASVKKQVTIDRIQAISDSEYSDARVVIKGCGDSQPTEDYYLHISQKLLPIVKTLMFGEPCSTVPIYKKKKSVS